MNGALVDSAETCLFNSVSNSICLNGAEETTISTSLVCYYNRASRELSCGLLGFFQGGLRTGRTGRTDRFNLLLAANGPRNGKAARKKVVTCIAVLNGDDVTSGTQTGYFLSQNNLSHSTCYSPSR